MASMASCALGLVSSTFGTQVSLGFSPASVQLRAGVPCVVGSLRTDERMRIFHDQNPHSARESSVKVWGPHQSIGRRNVAIKAAEGGEEVPEVIAEPAAEAPANPMSELKLQSVLLKKLAKKAELKRKRLVRKRHLRKKGRWPPSKMKKNQNV